MTSERLSIGQNINNLTASTSPVNNELKGKTALIIKVSPGWCDLITPFTLNRFENDVLCFKMVWKIRWV